MQSEAAILYEPVDDLSTSPAASIEEVTVAEPTGEEVLVEIRAASVCYTDVSAALGEKPEPYPVVMGHEGAGVVHDVGEAVGSVVPGDHVVLGRIACGQCVPCRGGRSNLCETRRTRQTEGSLRTGERGFSKGETELNHFHGVSSFTEYTMVTEEVAIPITDEIPLDEATLLGCGVFTGFGAVTNTADIETGSTVAVFGLGGVGLSAIQGARMRSASTIIGVDLVPEKREIAAELGATQTVDPNEEDVVEAIHEVTDGGVDYAFEAVGHPVVAEQVIRSLGRRGTAVLVGTPETGFHDIPVDLRSLTTSEKRVIGSFNGSYNLPLAIPKLAEFVAAGQLSLSPMISDSMRLADANDALEALSRGEAMRQVLIP